LLKIIKQNKVKDDLDLKDQDDNTNDNDLNGPQVSVPLSFTNNVKVIMNHIADVDKRITQVAADQANVHLADLKAHNASPNVINKVQSEINKMNGSLSSAQDEINKGNYHRAIDDYRDAWLHAQLALKFN
ncbi:MAG TPA: hypothetical protein VLT10_00005, partial [Verrucomicrobiae bacterium]|nr:hypothetical protein [Verrucomicrobiae bacterium]